MTIFSADRTKSNKLSRHLEIVHANCIGNTPD
jgi:hypothetical protein